MNIDDLINTYEIIEVDDDYVVFLMNNIPVKVFLYPKDFLY